MIPPLAPQRKFSPAAAAMAEAMTAQSNQNDPFDGLLSEARTRIRNQMQPAQIEDPTDDDLRTAEAILTPLVDQFFRNAQAQGVAFASESDQVLRQLMDDIFGFGPLASYLADEKVEEIICNGKDDIWIIHGDQGKVKISTRFRSERELQNFVNRVVYKTAARLDKSNPAIDGRMRDGSRLHSIMEPLTAKPPIAINIRRHRLVARTLEDLTRLGTVTPMAAEFLRLAVQARLNIAVAGGTASTTKVTLKCSWLYIPTEAPSISSHTKLNRDSSSVQGKEMTAQSPRNLGRSRVKTWRMRQTIRMPKNAPATLFSRAMSLV